MSTAKNLRTDPELPCELKEAALDGKLVLFVGAGASMLVGLPSWWGLAAKALADLRQIEEINFAELDQLMKLDPKKQLSIAALIAKDCGHDLNLRQYLKANNDSSIYASINSIKATCVTTNYDHELKPETIEKVTKDTTKQAIKRVSGANNLKAADLKLPGTVIHLHGDMANPETMIVTTSDYLEHYDDKNVQHFLKELFTKNTVLFIGYGLEEAEILEHILRRASVRPNVMAARERFLLQPFFNGEQSLYERLIKYYKRSFGVHLIGYSRDYNDYMQLEKIMAGWARELEVRPPALVDDLAAIDRIIEDE